MDLLGDLISLIKKLINKRSFYGEYKDLSKLCDATNV